MRDPTVPPRQQVRCQPAVPGELGASFLPLGAQGRCGRNENAERPIARSFQAGVGKKKSSPQWLCRRLLSLACETPETHATAAATLSAEHPQPGSRARPEPLQRGFFFRD